MTGQSFALEKELEERAKIDQVCQHLWHCYESMKAYLNTSYYPWVQANCPYYTEHGRNHVESVLEKCSQITAGQSTQLQDLEIFLILASTIWHDVGMVLQRSGHQNVVNDMLSRIGEIGFIEMTSKRLVSEIVRSHTGTKGLNIPNREVLCTVDNKSFKVRARALAAIVRFADEISETRSRISEPLRQNVPMENRIYWDYASCIAASVAQPERERVILEVELHDCLPLDLYQWPPEVFYADHAPQICLVQYIVLRIQKMLNELYYCAPEFRQFSSIKNIEVRMTAIKSGLRVEDYEETITFGEDGLGALSLPSCEIYQDFFVKHPRWEPASLKEALK